MSTTASPSSARWASSADMAASSCCCSGDIEGEDNVRGEALSGAGGLISYGATPAEVYTTAAEQVAKVLGGARPGDLPLRQATRSELVINRRTARALGITIPQSLLLRADYVVE